MLATRLCAIVLFAAAAAAKEAEDGPSGRYCGSVNLLLASEYVELWIHARSKKFDFRARGVATVPWCPGNRFVESETTASGDKIGVPDMTKLTKCLKHEMRHLTPGDEAPIKVTWKKASDSLSVTLKRIPVIGKISLSLTREACEEYVTNRAPSGTDEEL
eukprot:Rhum_TRINITY_DN17567_c0_g1::Rhum_TRINITY_DN17567_c0_g1_i1::g.166068::m.166068